MLEIPQTPPEIADLFEWPYQHPSLAREIQVGLRSRLLMEMESGDVIHVLHLTGAGIADGKLFPFLHAVRYFHPGG